MLQGFRVDCLRFVDGLASAGGWGIRFRGLLHCSGFIIRTLRGVKGEGGRGLYFLF